MISVGHQTTDKVQKHNSFKTNNRHEYNQQSGNLSRVRPENRDSITCTRIPCIITLRFSLHLTVKVKGKYVPVHHAMNAYCGSGGIVLRILNLDVAKCSDSRPRRFSPGLRSAGNNMIRGWMDSRAGMDVVAKRKIP
jgi:hypothetical protein